MNQREIKLRAWDKKNKEFVIVIITQGIHIIEAVVKSGGELEPWQQFTGLKDKNGKEIYESDLIKRKIYREDREKDEEIEVEEIDLVQWVGAGFKLLFVEYTDKKLQREVEEAHKDDDVLWLLVNDIPEESDLLEVIGNKYEKLYQTLPQG